MKNVLFITLLFIVSLPAGCDNKRTSDDLIYGNSFIRPDSTKVQVPEDWVTHSIFHGAFQIKLPPYMHKTDSTLLNEDYWTSSIYMYRDTIESGEYYYARVSIDYYCNPDITYYNANEAISIEKLKEIMEPFIQKALKGGMVAGYMIKDDKIINGPFYEVLSLSTPRPFKVYDTFYRRTGHGDPVSCHLYLLMNRNEAALIMVSYYDRDSMKFKDLFNVIKTFKWKRTK